MLWKLDDWRSTSLNLKRRSKETGCSYRRVNGVHVGGSISNPTQGLFRWYHVPTSLLVYSFKNYNQIIIRCNVIRDSIKINKKWMELEIWGLKRKWWLFMKGKGEWMKSWIQDLGGWKLEYWWWRRCKAFEAGWGYIVQQNHPTSYPQKRNVRSPSEWRWDWAV